MIAIFPILPAWKWSILVTICISKNKIICFPHIAPRKAPSICHAWGYSIKLGFSTTTCLAVIKSKSRHLPTTLKPYSPHQHVTSHLSSSHIGTLHLNSSCAAFGVRKAWRDWSRYGIQVGMWPSKNGTFVPTLVRVISGVARRWRTAENVILLPWHLEDLGARPLLLLAQVLGKATTLQSWSGAAMPQAPVCTERLARADGVRRTAPVSRPEVLFTSNSLAFLRLSACCTVCIWSIYVFKSMRGDG